jgi:hypothetical protein
LPLLGAEIVIDTASTVPFEVLLPIAEAQLPVTRADDVTTEVAENVVLALVLTVTLDAPTRAVTTKDEVDTETTVPNVPPKPPWKLRPPKPPPPKPRPVPGDPLGRGLALAPPPSGAALPNPPLGGVPPPPLPTRPKPWPQPEVDVTDTVRAVIAAAAGTPALLLAPTLTQSPFASDDNETAESFENRVDEAHATVVVPDVDCTCAPDEEIEITLPETPPKLPRANDGPEPPLPPFDEDAAVDDDGLELPPPQALTTNAVTARPHAASTRGWRAAELRGPGDR